MSESNPSPETGIQAGRPAASPETSIQARLGEGPLPPGIQEPAFLARLKAILDLHRQFSGSRPKPAMWGMIQLGTFILAVVMAFAVYNTLMASNVDSDLAGVIFILTFLGVCVLPDGLLWLGRRVQQAAAMRAILDNAESMLRLFGPEIDHCGGAQILADRVELEALVQVLDQRFHGLRNKTWGDR